MNKLNEFKNDLITKTYYLSENEESILISDINGELERFKRVLTNTDSYHFLIVEGSLISELMVKLLLKKEGYEINKNHVSLGQIISFSKKNNILPEECINFLDIIKNYRNKALHNSIKITKELLFDFLNAFNYFIQWFDNYYSNNYKNTQLNIYSCSNLINKFTSPEYEINGIDEYLNYKKIGHNDLADSNDIIKKIERRYLNYEKNRDNYLNYQKK